MDDEGIGASYAYDGRGNLIQTTPVNGRTITYDYDGLGRLIGLTNSSEGYTAHRYYRFDDRILQTVDGNNNVTQYTYDESYYNKGLLLSKTVGDKTISYTYDNWLNYREINDGGKITSYTYTGNNKLKSKTTPDGKTISYAYDDSGNITEVMDYSGTKTTYTYDYANRIKEIKGVVPQIYTYQSDGSGRLSKIASGTSKQEYTYNYQGEITSLVQTAGNIATTYNYIYDDMGNIIQEDKNDITQNMYNYDNSNRLIFAKNFSNDYGFETNYTYDARNNLTNKSTTHAPASTYTMNYSDSPEEYSNIISHTETFFYNGNKLTQRRENISGTVDGVSKTAMATTIYLHDNQGQIDEVIENYNNTTKYKYYDYNAQNQLIYSYFSDGKEITYTYDENGWLIREDTTFPSGSSDYILYTYDENGLKLTAATYDQYGCALSSRFTYDDAGRVIRIDYRSNGLNRYELYTYEDTSDGYMKIATQYNHLDKVEVTQVYTYVKVPQ